MSACPYCQKGEMLAANCIEIAKLSVSTLYLFREQSHAGRCVVAYDGHVGDIAALDAEQRNAFFADLAAASKAIRASHKPDKINYGAYSDTLEHLHFHLVPKYRDGFEWGGVFAMNPKQNLVDDKEGAVVAGKIKACL